MQTLVIPTKRQYFALPAVSSYQSTADIVADARTIIESAHDAVRRSVNTTLVLRNWYLGKRIAEEELKGADRAEYGKQIIERLSNELKTMAKGLVSRSFTNMFSSTVCFPQLSTQRVDNWCTGYLGRIIASFCA